MANWNWPSSEKLKTLRKQGVVPYSVFCTRCVLLVAFSLLLLASIDKLSAYTKASQLFIVSAFDEGVSKASLKLFYESFEGLLLPFVVVGFIVVMISGLLQNRFLFQLNLLNVDFSKLFSWNFSSFWSVLFQFVLGVISLAITSFVLYLMLINATYIASVVKELFLVDKIVEPKRLVTGSVVIFSILLSIIGIIWWLCQWVFFMWKHRSQVS